MVATPAQPDPAPELLHRAQHGDEAAFGELMRAYYDRTFHVVYAIVRHEADARDVCQEAWLTVWKQLHTFRGDSRFTTWLHAVASRRALDHLRKRRRWFDRFLPFGPGDDDSGPARSEPAAEGPAAAEQAEGKELVAQVRAAIAALPPAQRAVLALRELDGQSYEEIATALKIPVGTVMSRLFNARRRLAERLRQDLPAQNP